MIKTKDYIEWPKQKMTTPFSRRLILYGLLHAKKDSSLLSESRRNAYIFKQRYSIFSMLLYFFSQFYTLNLILY